MEAAGRQRLLRGDLRDLPPLNSRLVRIFTSSTFTDTVTERDLLIEDVYPKLKDYCKRTYGFDFQVVDMRWGVRDEATDDHTTTNMCIQEIENCQKLSVGPNFVALLGQRHGSRAVPSTIPSREFEALQKSLSSEGAPEYDCELMTTMYVRDDNSVPAVYNLRPISYHHPDYLAQDPEKKSEARIQWSDKQGRLQKVLQRASLASVERGDITQAERRKYVMSITEQEIERGIFAAQTDPSQRCMVFVRIIDDLPLHVQHPKAKRFVDLDDEGHIIADAQNRLNELRDKRLPGALAKFNLQRWSDIKWSDDGGINRQEHRTYLAQMASRFQESLISLLDRTQGQRKAGAAHALMTEILQHLHFASARCRVFQGRQETLDEVKDLLRGDPRAPIVIHAPSGAGKTSVMAMCAREAPQWLGNGRPVVAVRFLGTTPTSSSVRKALVSLCQQLSEVCGSKRDLNFEEVSDFSELSQAFYDCLTLGTPDEPIVVILDSLDQLSPTDYAHKLSWLPGVIPDHCYILISTLPEHHGILDTLKMKYPRGRRVALQTLGEASGLEIVRQWLRSEGRRLTEIQMQKVKVALAKCSLPLFVRLVFDQVVKWKSYDAVVTQGNHLPTAVRDVIAHLLESLEVRHGVTFVSHSLAYLTASRHGLSESEMEDILSLDDDVLTDVFQYHIPPVRRMPPLLWVRLKSELGGYLVTREADGSDVSSWYHRQFVEVARDRYLKDPSFVRAIHATLADFFSGRWFGKPKAFRYSEAQRTKKGLVNAEDAADRKVPEQPLWYGDTPPDGVLSLPEKAKYNLRRLNNVPYHLSAAGKSTELKETCLFSYKWLFHKLRAASVDGLMRDMELAAADEEVKCLFLALTLARSTLGQRPETLALEVSGRLARHYYTAGYPAVRKLIDECFTEGHAHCGLLPRLQCYNSPGGNLTHTLEHPNSPTMQKRMFLADRSRNLCLVTTHNELIVWDLVRGEIERTVPLLDSKDPALNVMCVSPKGDTLILGAAYQTTSNPVVLLDRSSGEILRKVELEKIYEQVGFVENYRLLPVGEDRLVAAVLGRAVDVFEVPSGCLLRRLDVKPSCVYLDTRTMALVVGLKDEDRLGIWDTRTWEMTGEEYIPGTAVDVTAAGRTIYVTCHKQDEAIALSLAEDPSRMPTRATSVSVPASSLTTTTGSRAIRVMGASGVGDTLLCLVGPHHILLWDCKKSRQRQMWNLVKHLPIVGRVPLETVLFSPDAKLVLAAYEDSVLLWRVKDGSLVRKMGSDSALKFTGILMTHDNRYLVTSVGHNKILKVWDLDQEEDAEDRRTPLQLDTACRYMAMDHRRPVAVVRSYDPRETCVARLDAGRLTHRISRDTAVRGPHISPSRNLALLRDFSSDGAVKVWSTETGCLLSVLPVSSLYLQTVTASGDDRYVLTHCEASATVGVKVQVWVTATGQEKPGPQLDVRQGGFSFIYFALSDALVVALQQYPQVGDGRECTVVVFCTDTGRELRKYPCVLKDSLHILPDTRHVLLTTCGRLPSDDRLAVVQLDLDGGKVIRELDIQPLGRLHFCGDGSRGVDVRVRVLDLVSGAVLCDFGNELGENLLQQNTNVWPRLTGDGELVVWPVLRESLVMVGHVARGQPLARCYTHARPLSLGVFLARSIAIGTDDGRIMALDVVDPRRESAAAEADEVRELYRASCKDCHGRRGERPTQPRDSNKSTKAGNNHRSQTCTLI